MFRIEVYRAEVGYDDQHTFDGNYNLLSEAIIAADCALRDEDVNEVRIIKQVEG